MTDRPYELVLHGATGFVGRVTARHLAARAGGLRIALSGRSEQRLRAVRDELGVDWPTIVTDGTDPAAVARLAERTAVVATAVGPYAKYGLPLVRACAEAGTSYCDLTGETSFVRDSIDAAHGRAVATGARIVHSAGFDSVPSDLGVLLLHERARADGAGTLGETALVLLAARGGVSGGTIDSMRADLDATRSAPPPPDALSPGTGAADRDAWRPRRDAFLDRWVAPNPFGPHDSRIVRRTNFLLDGAYGPGFRYREHLGVGRGPAAPLVAGAVTAGLGAFLAGMRFGPTRAVLDRLLPAPGDGPSEKAMKAGYFRVEVHTRTSTGARYVATVAGPGDPGYAATAVIFGETALVLAQDPPATGGGVLTPAYALGTGLADRLRAEGFELSVAPGT